MEVSKTGCGGGDGSNVAMQEKVMVLVLVAVVGGGSDVGMVVVQGPGTGHVGGVAEW